MTTINLKTIIYRDRVRLVFSESAAMIEMSREDALRLGHELLSMGYSLPEQRDKEEDEEQGTQ